MKTKLRKQLLVLSCLSFVGLASCSDDPTESPKDKTYLATEFVSSTIPASIPAQGGSYQMTFAVKTQTRAAQPAFEEWQYRILLGGGVSDPVVVKEPKTEILINIGENHAQEARAVVVEMAKAGTPPQWVRIVEAEQEASIVGYCVTKFKSTTIPELISYNGGAFEMTFETSVETRASDPIFVEWLYRVTIGNKVLEPVRVTEPTEKIDMVVEGNYTETQSSIVIEMAEVGETPQWTKIVEAKQDAALMKVADFYWAKGNVVLLNGKFAIAEKMSASGLYFRHDSKYGVPSDDTSYSGIAYTPDPVQVALSDIPYNQKNADPCTLIDANLRTPTYMELYYLYDQEDYTNTHQMDGVNGIGYVGSTFFMPYGGTLEIASGQISGKSQLGGYWGLGSNYAGDGVIYAVNAEYSVLDHDLSGTNMASLRCVKNIRQPSYVSHTPVAAPQDNALYALTIKTDAGEFPLYEVAMEASDGEYTQTDGTASKTEIHLDAPRNKETTEREWKIFVNRIYTGISFVQPGLKNYVLYVSHTPSKATSAAFVLSVKCQSDMASFPVVIKGSDGLELTQNGSKDNSTVSFQIPANTGKERTLSIWLNGEDLKKSVVQDADPSAVSFSVTWSDGYLTIVNGEYTFAGPKERGMYFKWKSKYGIKFDGTVSSSTKYLGTVYGPEQQSIPNYADIPSRAVDPCSLVAPAGSWYMPTAAMLEELVAEGSKEFQASAFRMCTDGTQSIYLATSGQLYKDGTKTMLPTIISVWTTTESVTKPGQYTYLMWSMTSATSAGSIANAGVVPETGMMVRCVRNK